jgi:uridine kinase
VTKQANKWKKKRSEMSAFPILNVIQYISSLKTLGKTIIVGIDGGSGAGKTTFSKWLAERISENIAPVSIVLTDRMYRPVAGRWRGPIENMPIGYDLHWERIRDEVIAPLRSGKMARLQLYDWVSDCLDEWTEIDPNGVTIIDGVFALRNELADYYDLRIWFSCPLEIRTSRLLKRGDTSQAEIDYWLPIEERYHTIHTPEKSAHIVIDSAMNMVIKEGNNCFNVVRWSLPISTQQDAAANADKPRR